MPETRLTAVAPEPLPSSLRELLVELRESGTEAPTLLRQEAERIGQFSAHVVSTDMVAPSATRTKAIIMAESAAAIVAQATFSQQNVGDLLRHMSVPKPQQAERPVRETPPVARAERS